MWSVMLMSKEKLIKSGLLEMYVLGLTTEEERMVVLEGIQKYPEIAQEMNQLKEALDQYAASQSIIPPEKLKESIFENIANSQKRKDNPNPKRFKALRAWVLPLLLLFLLVLTGLNFSLYQKVNTLFSQKGVLVDKLNQTEQLLAACENGKEVMDNRVAFIEDSSTSKIILSASGKLNIDQLLVYYNPLQKLALLQVIQLAIPPPGMQYQLWAESEGKMLNMGLFEPSSTQVQQIQFVPETESFNLTLEPTGGSITPSTDRLILTGKNNLPDNSEKLF